MKRILGAGLFVVAALLLVMGLAAFLPKYSGFLRLLFFYLLFDAGLWLSVNLTLGKYSKPARILIAVGYWSPMLISAGSALTVMVIPYLYWPIAFRTYLVSAILILFLVKLFPVVLWMLSILFRTIRLLFTGGLFRKDSFNVRTGMDFFVLTGWITGTIVFIVMVGGMIFGQFAFTVSRQEIILNDLPESFNGFRIVHVSDIHLGSWTCSEKLAVAVDSINDLHPDVIFFTGDMFNYSTVDGNDFGEILSQLKAIYGVYAILGNHDYGDYIKWSSTEAKKNNMVDLKSWYKKLGWKLLLNSNEIIHKGNDSIAVIGVENWGATKRFQRLGDVATARTGTEKMAVQLLLSHDPTYWDRVISKKYQDIDITFSGHTHGGQVGIAAKNFAWSPVSWLYPQWSGLYRNAKSQYPQFLYVNTGLGNIGYAGRIGILPEITLITLNKN
ncbi:MAG: metallophosphoesterase [Bacteroidetes bacterium]|nr:metallophosphoesterase [Bacteroidota bacterium]